MEQDIAIRVEGLGKRYLIGHQSSDRDGTLRDALTRGAGNFVRIGASMLRGAPVVAGDRVEDFWALKDLSFEIRRGDVVGVIGRNGAGKSTLLKVLSRITEPTEGRVEINGRVASLLEVGTGFHPELSGRENVYLNGAILGMSRSEIRGKFDEIVSFAEVEKFIDTPVKRYSSGMYVRLAFAVAAHLEPEILIVDEVLAVGDSEFQKKCLGKIGDIASTGRTILFVSHNLTSIRALCGVALLLNKGRAQTFGAAALTIDQYRSNYQASRNRVSWPECDAPGDSDVKLLEVSVSQAGAPADFFTTGTPITIVFRVICSSVPRDLSIGFELSTDDGTSLLWSHHTDLDESMWPRIEVGMNVVTCSIPPGILNAGRYLLAPKLSIHRQRWIANLDHLLALEVHLGHGTSPFWTTLSGGKRWGLIAPIFDWSSEAKADV